MNIIKLNQKEVAAVSGGVDHNGDDCDRYGAKCYGYGAKVDAEIEAALIAGCSVGWSVGATIGVICGVAILVCKYAPQATAASRIKTVAAIFGSMILGDIISDIVGVVF